MKYSPQDVLDHLIAFAQEIKLQKPIDGVIFREGYQDYQVILDNTFHCEIREKLIEMIMTDPKHVDTRREIAFLLQHPAEYEEWEDTPVMNNLEIEMD